MTYLSVNENLLIVEDDPEWCGIYQRIGSAEGLTTIKVADDLRQANSLIDAMRFAIAFIDVGLSVGEDQNVDGLRVMRKIREMGDQTSIVVVTGRSGRDVLSITRDSIVKYQVHDIVGKAEIGLKDLRALVRTGLNAFQKKAASDRSAHELLRGEVPALVWDDEMLRGTGVKDGVMSFYDFLDHLMSGLLPVVAGQSGGAAAADPATGLMHCSYWSRSIGKAIAVCFGDAELAHREMNSARSEGCLLGRYNVSTLLQDFQGHGLCGGVFELVNATRDNFVVH